MLQRIKQVLCCLLSVLAEASWSATPWQMNMYEGVTPISHDVYYLHMVCMAVCAVIGVVVFGVMIYSLIYHRKSQGYVPATFHDNVRLEIVWSLIPFLILVALAWPATRVLMRMDNTEYAAVTVKITGYQWRWQYEYLDEGIKFFSILKTPYAQIQNKAPKDPWYLLDVDNPLVVPVHKKIRFLVTSNDVIHSWWVPELAIKRDAIPGFIYEAWAKIEKPGVYRGQCAELCGINHGFMPIVVKAVSEEDYAAWVKAEKKAEQIKKTEAPQSMTREALLTLGKARYDDVCSACHNANGHGLPPLYPALKASSVAVGHPVDRHIQIILEGVPGSAMQGYESQLSNEEIAAIASYERNAWGNNTDDLIQPIDVARLRRQAKKHVSTTVKQANKGVFHD